MDRRSRARSRVSRWFPRPRGDGPLHGLPACRHLKVSPPTRGWTSVLSCYRVRCGGFPAHAGMDQRYLRAGALWMRFPRPRGDGPEPHDWPPCASRVSPPTRGWTPSSARGRRRKAGFPAHAGMDPRPATGSRSPRRFPRPRGDGPQCRLHTAARIKVSPPTRGWTVDPLYLLGLGDGFPAHAGMDRG